MLVSASKDYFLREVAGHCHSLGRELSPSPHLMPHRNVVSCSLTLNFIDVEIMSFLYSKNFENLVRRRVNKDPHNIYFRQDNIRTKDEMGRESINAYFVVREKTIQRTCSYMGG